MAYVRWTIAIVFWGLVGLILLYTLPKNDVVRLVDTETRRIDFGDNSIFWANTGTGNAQATASRDIYFISGVRPNGRVRVYRNEDTGWIWPPYFKLNSSNLQAKASDLISTKENPKWVLVRHYGWRFEPLSIYPNAVAVREIANADAKPVNWFNIVFLVVFAAFVLFVHFRIRRFWNRRIDPVLDDISDGIEAAGDAVEDRRSRFRKWLDGWKQT
ncbi:MAG: DUF1523 family protein [Marinibacterium sp.]